MIFFKTLKFKQTPETLPQKCQGMCDCWEEFLSNVDSIVFPVRVFSIRDTIGVQPPPPLAECEELVQTDPDGSQMATDNLSCPRPTKGAQTSDDFWQIMVSRGTNDIYIHAEIPKYARAKTLWRKGGN